MAWWAFVLEGVFEPWSDVTEAETKPQHPWDYEGEPFTGYIEVPGLNDLPFRGARYYPTAGFQPSEHHDINTARDTWTLNRGSFEPALRLALKDYRNEVLAQDVEFNGVTAKNTLDEQAVIHGIIAYLKANNSDEMINWKQPDNSFTDAYFADFQGLQLTGGQNTQKAFAAERHVLAIHDNTPYDFIIDAIGDFDDYYEGGLYDS